MRLKLLPLLFSLVLGAGLSLVAQSINGSGVRFNGTTQKEFVNAVAFGNGVVCATPSLTFSANAADGWARSSTGHVEFCSNGSNVLDTGGTGIQLAGTTGTVAWTANGNPIGAADTTLSRSAAGVIQAGTTTNNALGKFNAAGYQVAGAPGIGLVATHANPANQTGNATATLKMNGLGAAAAPCTITPTATGRIMFVITGDMANGTLADGVSYNMVWGQGIAPANAGPAAGAIISASRVFTQAVGGELTPFTLYGMTTANLTLNLAVWFDMQIADLTGGTASVSNIDCTAFEL